jgi:hypothetical protein
MRLGKLCSVLLLAFCIRFSITPFPRHGQVQLPSQHLKPSLQQREYTLHCLQNSQSQLFQTERHHESHGHRGHLGQHDFS